MKFAKGSDFKEPEGDDIKRPVILTTAKTHQDTQFLTIAPLRRPIHLMIAVCGWVKILTNYTAARYLVCKLNY